MLGDSVAFGHGVEAHEAFPQILETILRSRGDDVEVFNVALPGWSTRQQRIAYERIVRAYRPDLVLLSICLNDPAELQNNLAKPPRWLTGLYARSAVVRMALGASRREIAAVEELFVEPAPASVEAAYARFFEEVEKLADDVARDGARLALVVNPFRFQLEPAAPPPVAQGRIAAFGSEKRLQVIDLLGPVAGSGGARLFIDYDHWTPEGARVVAGAIAATPGVSSLTATASDGGSRERELLKVSRATAGAEPCALATEAVDAASPRVRWAAAIATYHAGIPGHACLDALIRGVRHGDERVRRFATWTLGEMGPVARPAIPALVELARKDGGSGRTGATTAIGKIGGDAPEAIPLFVEDLKHAKENRRIRAARALGRLGAHAAPALGALREALRDGSPTVRLLALEAIAGCGEAARPAIDDVVAVMNGDADPDVKKAASRALSRIPGR